MTTKEAMSIIHYLTVDIIIDKYMKYFFGDYFMHSR